MIVRRLLAGCACASIEGLARAHACCIRARPCTRAARRRRWIWASDAAGGFSISEDEGENPDLGRGTLIKIHLKQEAMVRARAFVCMCVCVWACVLVCLCVCVGGTVEREGVAA